MRKDKIISSRVLSFVLVFLLAGQAIFATTPQVKPASQDHMSEKIQKLKSKTIPVGKVEKGRNSFKLGDIDLPTYECMDVSYVLVSDLKQAGGNVVWNGVTGKTVIYDLNQVIAETQKFQTLEENSIGYLGRDAVYINYQEIPAIYVGTKALIPAKWIPLLYIEKNSDRPVNDVIAKPIDFVEEIDMEKVDDIKETDQTEEAVEIEEIEEISETSEIIENETSIRGINIWFNGKDYIEEAYDFSGMGPGEFGYYKDRRYDGESEYIYVGFVITTANGISNNDADFHRAWLKNPTYHTIPEGLSKEVLETLFPTTYVTGLMKYASGGFSKGEEVTIFNASSGRAYHLLGKDGKMTTIPWGSIAIKQSPVTKEEASKEQIEAYINSKDFESKTNYFVWTDIYRQRTYVLKGSKNKWELIRTMVSTTGKDTTPTPTGRYTLNVRVPAFGMEKGYRAKNAYAFIGTTYLYHSVIYDRTGSYLLNGWGNLGSKGSTGCVRLSPEDSIWLYETMPIGTSIFIN